MIDGSKRNGMLNRRVFMAVLSLAALLCMPVCLFAQAERVPDGERVERSYRQFRSLFESLLDDTATMRIDACRPGDAPGHYFDTSAPVVLPAWMFSEHTCNDTVFVIGVSDPGMDGERGLALARKRALAVAALSHRPGVANIRDYFSAISENRHQEIYIEFTRYHATAAINPDSIVVSRTFITRYDETVVLAGIPVSSLTGEVCAGGGMELRADLYSHLRRSGRSIDMDEKLNMEILFHGFGGDTVNIASSYTSINKAVAGSTSLNGDVISDLSWGGLRYTAGSPARDGGQPADYRVGEPGNTRTGTADLVVDTEHVTDDDLPAGGSGYDVVKGVAVSLENGLWHALISGMLSALCDIAHGGTIHFRQVSDLYDNMPVLLSRELVSVRVASSAPAIMVDNNILYLSVAVNDKDNQL